MRAEPEEFQQWTGESLRQWGGSLQEEAAAGAKHAAVRPLSNYANDATMLTYRDADGAPEWHGTQADIFFVQSGSATLVVGGTMVGAETVAPDERRNGVIEGGERRKLAPGDIVRIPPRVPHQLLLEGSPGVTYFVIKVKNV